MSSVRTTENAEATRRRRTAAAACSQREEGSCQQWSDIRYRLRIEGKGEDRFDFIPFQSLHLSSFLSGTGVCTSFRCGQERYLRGERRRRRARSSRPSRRPHSILIMPSLSVRPSITMSADLMRSLAHLALALRPPRSRLGLPRKGRNLKRSLGKKEGRKEVR